MNSLWEMKVWISWESEECRGKGLEVGQRGVNLAVEIAEERWERGCLECRHIAQRGPGKKALQCRLSAKFWAEFPS